MMPRSLIIIAAIAAILLAVVALPFVVGLFSFRLDSFYHLKGNPSVTNGPLAVSFDAIECHATGQKYSIPGALAPNEKANGFQVTWELKGDYKRKLTVEDIKAELLDGGTSKPLDVPFNYWDGEFNAAKNVHYAFISTGGYPDELPLGIYRVQLSYTANGVPYHDEVTLNYEVERKFGFHAPFYSKYF